MNTSKERISKFLNSISADDILDKGKMIGFAGGWEISSESMSNRGDCTNGDEPCLGSTNTNCTNYYPWCDGAVNSACKNVAKKGTGTEKEEEEPGKLSTLQIP